MKQAHFYAYGIIAEEDPFFAAFTGQPDPVISAKKVVDFLNANKDAEEVVVHINSRGGSVWEGFAIHDILTASGKKITTVGEGLVASIATVVFMAGSIRQLSKNTSFMVHAPAVGSPDERLTADVLQKMADDIKVEEQRIVDFYVDKTGADRAAIEDMMKEDTYIPADKALEMKFATEIVGTVKAIAFYHKPNKESEMSKQVKTLGQKIDSILAFLGGDKKALEATPPAAPAAPQAKEVKTSDGKTLSIQGDVVVGSAVTMDGQPAPDASFTLEDGTMITTDADSKISAVTPAADAATAALKAENEALKAKVAEFESAQAEMETKVSAITERLSKMTSTGNPPTSSGTQFRTDKGTQVALTEKERREALLKRNPKVAQRIKQPQA